MSKAKPRDIQSRLELFELLQSQMQTAYHGLREDQRLKYESLLVKSYVFEVDIPAGLRLTERTPNSAEFVQRVLSWPKPDGAHLSVRAKDEPGFFELNLDGPESPLRLFLDTATNPRFWLGFSLSTARLLDRWFEAVALARTDFDLVWLWPDFLEGVQQRGEPRGFGLDYDFRRLDDPHSDTATYLKMQLWGGRDTLDLYRLLKDHEQWRGKVVLSKVRLKEYADPANPELFALQDVKFTGKFTSRGTDFATHNQTLSYVRHHYEVKVRSIESSYALRWSQASHGGNTLEGFAIHYLPQGFELPVMQFCERALDGSLPFRLFGLVTKSDDTAAEVEVVDLHTGDELSMEVLPDRISVYLPEGACGNSIVRLYTNLLHFFNRQFRVEADNADQLF